MLHPDAAATFANTISPKWAAHSAPADTGGTRGRFDVSLGYRSEKAEGGRREHGLTLIGGSAGSAVYWASGAPLGDVGDAGDAKAAGGGELGVACCTATGWFLMCRIRWGLVAGNVGGGAVGSIFGRWSKAIRLYRKAQPPDGNSHIEQDASTS